MQTMNARGATLLVVVPVAIALFGLLAAATQNAPSNAAEARGAVRAAIAELYDAGTFKEPGWQSGKLASDKVVALHVDLDKRLKSHFTGTALAEWSPALHEAIDRDSDGEHLAVTAGGVDKIEYATATAEDGGTVITGRAHIWITWVIKAKSWDGDRAGRDEGWSTFDATIVDVDHHLLVSELDLIPETAP